MKKNQLTMEQWRLLDLAYHATHGPCRAAMDDLRSRGLVTTGGLLTDEGCAQDVAEAVTDHEVVLDAILYGSWNPAVAALMIRLGLTS